MQSIKKALALILTACLLFSVFAFNTGALNQDVDLDVGSGNKDTEVDVTEPLETEISEKATFTDTKGAAIPAADEYSKVTVTGEKTAGSDITVSVDFDEESGAFAFGGWYNGTEQLATTKDFKFKYGEIEKATPVIISKNVLTEGGSFESIATSGSAKVKVWQPSDKFTNNTGGKFYTGDAPVGHKWGWYTNFTNYKYDSDGQGGYVEAANPTTNGMYIGDNWFTIKSQVGDYTHTYYTSFNPKDNPQDKTTDTVIVKPRSGNVMMMENFYSRSAIKELTGLKEDTDYVLSVWLYAQNDDNYVNIVSVATNYVGLRTNMSTADSSDCVVLGTAAVTPTYGQWQQVKVTFNSGDNTKAYLHLSNASQMSSGDQGMVFVDDLTVYETDTIGLTGQKLLESGKVLTQGVVEVVGTAADLPRTASGIEFKLNAEGTVKANFANNNWGATHCHRLNLFIDGEDKGQIILTKDGLNEVVLATNLAKGEHTFKLERITEAQVGEVRLEKIEFNGELLSLIDDRELNIDFIGDSITAGWGAADTSKLNEVQSSCKYCLQDGSATYAAITANNLNANYNVFAYSGWGVSVTGANDGVSAGTTIAQKFPEFEKNTNADYVVVNLGTNDASKYVTAGLTKDQVKSKFAEFANTLRSYYANSTIIFAYGMMTEDANEFVEYGYNALKNAGDENVYMVKLTGGKDGDSGHPNNAQQAVAGAELTAFINSLGATLAGDVNGDGDVALADVSLLAQKVAEWDVTVDEKVADINGDGDVTLADVSTLAQYVAGWSNVEMSGDVYKEYYAEEHTLKDLESKLKLTSRASFMDANGLRMEWSYSGFELQGQFEGDMYLTGLTSTKDLIAYAVIDGDFDNAKLVRISGTVAEFKIAEGLKAGLHTVKFFKATEATGGYLTVKGIKYNGAIFAAPEDKALTIDFIGDSITSASSLYSAEAQPDAVLRGDAIHGYASKVLRALNADGSIISISGGAACTAGKTLLKNYYPRTYHSAATPAWSFNKQADIVVIALGTNDTPSYQGVGSSTTPTSVLNQGIKDMVASVRSLNPNAKIVWAYGAMDTRLESVYTTAISEIQATDSNVYYCHLTRIDCTGLDGHPGPAGHTHNAGVLTDFIRNTVLAD